MSDFDSDTAINDECILRRTGDHKNPVEVRVGPAGWHRNAARLTRAEAQKMVTELTRFLARTLDAGDNAKGSR